ncbi:MAG: hypothetical protein LBR53_05710 [Deltaproteobacteria bacterium]|jgi:hypothetical protein|nr:hypothetical protein [Deltaproteobacteria bacterium]
MKKLLPSLFGAFLILGLLPCLLNAQGQPQAAPPAPQASAQGSPAQGPDAMQSLRKAQDAHALGDNLTALEAIFQAQQAIWNFSPLGIRNAVFVLEEPEYFGTYKPKTGENFTSSELLIFYCEPIGYTQRLGPDGTYTNSLSWSFEILDQSGKTIGGGNNIGPYEHTGYRTFITEKMQTMTINMSQFPAGSYILQITMTDNLDPTKSVTVQKPFNLVSQ